MTHAMMSPKMDVVILRVIRGVLFPD